MEVALKKVSRLNSVIFSLTLFLFISEVLFAQAGLIQSALAQSVPAVAPQAAPPPSFSEVLSRMLPMFALVFMIYYFMIVKPQQLKAKSQADLTSSLKKGDNVVTSGGIYGRVAAVESDGISIEIAPNVKIKVELIHIARKVEPAEMNGANSSITKVK